MTEAGPRRTSASRSGSAARSPLLGGRRLAAAPGHYREPAPARLAATPKHYGRPRRRRLLGATAFAQLGAAVANPARLAETLPRIHATLDPPQRAALPELVRHGSHGHGRCARGHA